MPEVVICGWSPSVVVDDVATFVDIEHSLEFTVDNYFHGLFQCGCKVHLDAEITLSCKMETATVATVGGYIKAEEGVSFAKVITRQLVPFVLCLFTSGGKQVDVASNVAAGLEVWLERFGRNLTSVDVDGQEVNGVVLGVEWETLQLVEWSRPCSPRVVSDTWLSLFPRLLCEPF